MSKQQSLIIRGIAILLMILYHLYDIRDDYTSLLYIGKQPLIYYLHNVANPINFFIVLSGYGLSVKAYSTSFKEKLLKILKLYVVFWIVMIIFPIIIGPYVNPGKYPGTGWDTFFNAIGYKSTYNAHNWFLLPYVIIFIMSDVINKFVEKVGNIISVLISVVIYFLSSYIISRYGIKNLGLLLYHCCCVAIFFFPFVVGIVMERLNGDGKLNMKKLVSPLAISILVLLTIIRSLFQTHALHPFFAIVVVYLLLNIHLGGSIEKILTELGKYSMPMWFIHGYLMVYIFKDDFCLLNYPFLIYIAVVLVSYILSIPIMKLGGIVSMCLTRS